MHEFQALLESACDVHYLEIWSIYLQIAAQKGLLFTDSSTEGLACCICTRPHLLYHAYAVALPDNGSSNHELQAADPPPNGTDQLDSNALCCTVTAKIRGQNIEEEDVASFGLQTDWTRCMQCCICNSGAFCRGRPADYPDNLRSRKLCTYLPQT